MVSSMCGWNWFVRLQALSSTASSRQAAPMSGPRMYFEGGISWDYQLDLTRKQSSSGY